MVERGRGKGKLDVDCTGGSSGSEEGVMFEAQRVTLGELTKCDERTQGVAEIVQEFQNVVRLCEKSLPAKNLVFRICFFREKTVYL